MIGTRIINPQDTSARAVAAIVVISTRCLAHFSRRGGILRAKIFFGRRRDFRLCFVCSAFVVSGPHRRRLAPRQRQERTVEKRKSWRRGARSFASSRLAHSCGSQRSPPRLLARLLVVGANWRVDRRRRQSLSPRASDDGGGGDGDDDGSERRQRRHAMRRRLAWRTLKSGGARRTKGVSGDLSYFAVARRFFVVVAAAEAVGGIGRLLDTA